MSEFIEKLKSRRSVRSFKSDMPPKEVIDEILELLMALGVDEQTAKEDACRVEHDLSVESFEAIKEYCRKNLQIQ